MVIFDTCGLFLESKTDLRAKVTAIDAIITALYSQLLATAQGTGGSISEYQLNDGQTIIKQVYQGADSITKGIQSLRVMRQDYINQINGRVFRAVDSKNFTGPYGSR